MFQIIGQAAFKAQLGNLMKRQMSIICIYFSKKQPDLNWQNPKVRQECIDIMNYWVDKGVDGFRLDVINLISKDESQYYVDSTIKGHQVCANGPHIHEYIQEMNQKYFLEKNF